MISAGGTGGGVYPALAAARALRDLVPDDQLTLSFVGARGDMARGLVRDSGIRFDSYQEVFSGPLHGVPRAQQVVSAAKIAAGTLEALATVLRRRPEALFLTGGWTGVPVALACRALRVPIVIYVPDIEPGLTLKIMGRHFARVIAATVAQTGEFFPGKRVVETGYPLRPEILQADRAAAQQAFKLDPARQTLLVFGGSRGSRSINTVIAQIVPQIVAAGVQVLHISGRLDWPAVRDQHAALDPAVKAHYQVFDFLPDIGQAFAAADLVISRAGAATLAEYPELGLPAILVPYPYAWRYQRVNADWLVERGAALRLDDDKLGTELLPLVLSLLGDPARLAGMRAAMLALKRSDGAQTLARLLAQTAGHPLP